MNAHCPNCDANFLRYDLLPADTANPRAPGPGSLILCAGCGDVFEVIDRATLVPWSKDVPAHIARMSALVRASRRIRKAALN